MAFCRDAARKCSSWKLVPIWYALLLAVLALCNAAIQAHRPQQALVCKRREHGLQSALLSKRVQQMLDIVYNSVEILHPSLGKEPTVRRDEHRQRAHYPGDDAEEVNTERDHG
jgi:hypothetical protein